MYSIALTWHSLFRWLLLASLVLAICRASYGWLSRKDFSGFDNLLRHGTATIAHIQLMIGLCLYVVSPIVAYFLKNYSAAMSQREIRFFGMEHALMMLIAITVITMGSARAKRKSDDVGKFKTMALWFLAALVIIFFSIPWSFLPFYPDRPLIRF